MPILIATAVVLAGAFALWRSSSVAAGRDGSPQAFARRLGSAVKAAATSFQTSHNQKLSVEEARALLGVNEQAGRDQIEAAYRRLMLRAHPDVGGTSALAAQITAARDRLIKMS